MGNTLATNVTDQMMRETVNINSQIVQSAGVVANFVNRVDIDENCVIKDSFINQKNIFSYKSDVVQKAAQNADISQVLKDQITQKAEAIGQNLDFNPGSVDSRNIIKMSLDMATTVQQMVAQNNSAFFKALNEVSCKGHGTYDNTSITQVNEINAILSSMQNDEQIQSIKQDMEAVISQSALAKKEDAIGAIFMMLAIIACAIAYVVAKTGEGASSILKSPAFWMAGVPTLYGGISYYLRLPPFTDITANLPETPCSNDSECGTGNGCQLTAGTNKGICRRLPRTDPSNMFTCPISGVEDPCKGKADGTVCNAIIPGATCQKEVCSVLQGCPCGQFEDRGTSDGSDKRHFCHVECNASTNNNSGGQCPTGLTCCGTTCIYMKDSTCPKI
jgi:hypothetical protein